MRGSIVVWSLMASAPALLLGVLGIVGRTQISTWDFESYSPGQREAILAYQEPVLAAQGLDRRHGLTKDHIDELRSATSLWLTGRSEGTLLDVFPGSMEDQGASGAKAQILEARQALINYLSFHSADLRKERDWAGSALASAQALAMADIMKYSGAAAIQQSTLTQASALRVVEGLLPFLSPEERAKTLPFVEMAHRPERPYLLMAEELSHVSIRDKMRQGKSLPDMNQVFQASSLALLLERPRPDHSSRWSQAPETCGLDSVLSNSFTAAIRGEVRLQAALQRVLSQYGPKEDHGAAVKDL